MDVANREAQQAEVDRNFDVFLALQPRLAQEHPGATVLLKGGEVKGFYQSLADAEDAGKEMFSEEPFSVQEVCPPEGDLGFFSHAIDIGAV
jgi:hypothetical protein